MVSTCHSKISFRFTHLTFKLAVTGPTRIQPLAGEELPAPITSFSKFSCHTCRNSITNKVAAPTKTATNKTENFVPPKKDPRKNTTQSNPPPSWKAARKQATPAYPLQSKPTGQLSTNITSSLHPNFPPSRKAGGKCATPSRPLQSKPTGQPSTTITSSSHPNFPPSVNAGGKRTTPFHPLQSNPTGQPGTTITSSSHPNFPPSGKAGGKRTTPSHPLQSRPTGQSSTTTAHHPPLSRVPPSEQKNLLHLPPPKSAQSLLPHSTKIPAPKGTTRSSFLPALNSASSKLTLDSRTLPISKMASLNITADACHHPFSEMEAKHYYYGLRPQPVLIARTGSDAWIIPTGLEAYLKPKELGTVCDSGLSEIWEDSLAMGIHEILEEKAVQWTSTDIVQIGFVGESTCPIIWIGVAPNTLSHEDGQGVADACKDLLTIHNITDMEVELREANFFRYSSPKLKKPASSIDPIAHFIQPLTPTSGLSICNFQTPELEETGGFFLGDRSSLYLVTARHVVFKADQMNNQLYKWKPNNEPIEVTLFGTRGFKKYLAQIEHEIKIKNIMLEFQGSRIKTIGERRDIMEAEEFQLELADAVKQMKEAADTIMALEKLLKHVKQVWGDIANRVLGRVEFSPPIKLLTGSKKFTQDFALIKINNSIMEVSRFPGNVLDLGTEIPPPHFTAKMFPNSKNEKNFTYPPDRLLKVNKIIPDAEMRKLPMYDDNGKKCLVVLKRGNATGLTLGRANGIKSFTRCPLDNCPPKVSKEWAILPYDEKSGPFAAPGDSGAAIIDCLGRLGGLLTGGSGGSKSGLITYATPVSFILENLKAHGYNVSIEATLPS